MSEALRREDAAARSLAQREYVRPVVLEAGAGTGKTATLVARIVVWCLGPGWERAEGELAPRPERDRTPERIAAFVLRRVVAITFTEAAAAEMALRVERALAAVEGGEAVVGLDDEAMPPLDARVLRAARLRDALDQLPVQTIHAYARQLLAAHPFEAGLHPSLDVDADGRVQRELVREVLEAQLRDAYEADGPAFALAAQGFGPAELEAELGALIDAGVRARDLSQGLLAPEAVRDLFERVRTGLEEFARFGAALAGARRARKAKQVAETLAALRAALPAVDEASVDALRAFLAEAETLGVEDTLPRLRDWARGKLGREEQDLLGAHGERLGALCRTLGPLLAHLCDLDLDTLERGRRVLGATLELLEQRMQQRGVATFASLLGDAADLLRTRADVAGRVRRGIDQLLVDEFQDTDPRQCAIVGALALEGEVRPGLFLVGDPKQSIYGWRDADLEAYEGFVRRVLDAGGSLHRLSVNYRSFPAVLDEVERVVAPVMQREPGVQPGFEPLVPCLEFAERAWPDGARFAGVEHWVVTDRDAETGAPASLSASQAARREAQALAADLRALHAEGDLRWRDVGLLFRSRGEWDVYLGALREAGIPFAVEGDRTYYRRREIIEAAAWVRCVLDPEDRVALVTALRSASVGVPDAAWLPLVERDFLGRVAALDAPNPAELEALGKEIDVVAAALPGDVPGLDRVRGWSVALRATLASLAELRRSFAEDPADRFVESLRHALAFEATEAARFLGAWRVANLDRFFRELAERLASGASQASVLRGLRQAVAEEEPRGEQPPPDAALDAVRIFTIHGAKGLDFRHVYLLQLHKGSARPPGPSVDAAPGARGLEFRLLGVPTLGFDAVASRRERVSEAELVRLLYVGMTRARERLVVSGVWPSFLLRSTRGGSHAALLPQRSESPAVERLGVELAEQASASRDLAGARFVFPALREETLPRGDRASDAASVAPELSAREVARWAKRVRDAEARMERSLGGRASDSHEEETPRLRGLPRRGSRRDAEVARLAGIGVHAALEHLDLESAVDASLRAATLALPDRLAPHASGALLPAALDAATVLLERLSGGSIAARLESVRGAVIGREVPVLVPPAPEDPALGFVAGSIDLVFEDRADGALVVVDYKTDAVEDETDLEARVVHYAPQLRLYARALSEALGSGREVRAELWFLAADRCVSVETAPCEAPDQLTLGLSPQN